MKKQILNVVIALFAIAIIVFQFTLPFAIVNEVNITAFNAALEYGNVHWTFSFIWIIFALIIAIFVFLGLGIKKGYGKPYQYLSFLAGGGAFINIMVLAFLQNFLDGGGYPGLNDHSGNGLITFFAFAFLFFIPMARWNTHTEETIKTLLNTKELDNYLKDKKVIYEDTILLNPGFWDTVKHPDPVKIVATDKEFVVGSQPLTIIPFKSIADMKFNPAYNMKIKIATHDGRIFKVIWGPIEKYAPYHVMATNQLYGNLQKIIEENK